MQHSVVPSNEVNIVNSERTVMHAPPSSLSNRLETLTERDVSFIISLLREESSMTDARGKVNQNPKRRGGVSGVDYVNYYGLLNAKKKCQSKMGNRMDALFSPNTFLKLQAGGAVSTFVFEAYLTRYAEMLRIVSFYAKARDLLFV